MWFDSLILRVLWKFGAIWKLSFKKKEYRWIEAPLTFTSPDSIWRKGVAVRPSSPLINIITFEQVKIRHRVASVAYDGARTTRRLGVKHNSGDDDYDYDNIPQTPCMQCVSRYGITRNTHAWLIREGRGGGRWWSR